MSSAYGLDLSWLVTDFTARVADVAHAVVVSADGVPLAPSKGIPSAFAGRLAAITSGLTTLMQGAARLFEAGQPTQALVQMEGGLMFVMAISDGTGAEVDDRVGVRHDGPAVFDDDGRLGGVDSRPRA